LIRQIDNKEKTERESVLYKIITKNRQVYNLHLTDSQKQYSIIGINGNYKPRNNIFTKAMVNFLW
jgi:hypothetical protein